MFSLNLLLEIARIGEGKKIFQLEYISEEHLLVVVSGKQRQVRLVPIRALDGDETEWIKVAESKGCSVLTVGPVLKAPLTFCLCVAVKKQVCGKCADKTNQFKGNSVVSGEFFHDNLVRDHKDTYKTSAFQGNQSVSLCSVVTVAFRWEIVCRISV